MQRRLGISTRAGHVAVSCLLCLGFWQLGQGAYIPAKAWFAQELMQRAWRKAQDGDGDTAPWPWADTRPIARLSAKGGDIELIVLEGASGPYACIRTRSSERDCTTGREGQQHYCRTPGYTFSIPAVHETR